MSRVKTKRKLLISFSKVIVDELKKKVGKTEASISTLHAFGYRTLLKRYKTLPLQPAKYIRQALAFQKDQHDPHRFKKALWADELCQKARLTMSEDFLALAETYGLQADPEVVELAEKLLEFAKLKTPKQVDFTDMLYLPVHKGLLKPEWDFVAYDEIQDSSKVQQLMVDALLGSSGQLLAVGDPRQAIYGFSGAMSDGFWELADHPEATTLPLSVSFRCPVEVVALAQTIWPEIQPWALARPGELGQVDQHSLEEGDMVLSRTTAPLISLAFSLIVDGKKCQVVGQDIEQGLKKVVELVGQAQTKLAAIDMLTHHLNELLDFLASRGVTRPDQHKSYEALEDQVNCALTLLDHVDRPAELAKLVHDLFHPHKKAVRLMTIHRAKGLEAPSVVVITHFNGKPLMPSSYAEQAWEKEQERNLEYVAYTRSQKKLLFTQVEG